MSLLTTWRKRKHFKRQIMGWEGRYWDEEFRKYRLKEGREDVRLQHDRIKEHVVLAKKQLEQEMAKKQKDQVTIDKLKQNIEKLPKDVEQLKSQIDKVDAEIVAADTAMANVQILLKMLKEHWQTL